MDDLDERLRTMARSAGRRAHRPPFEEILTRGHRRTRARLGAGGAVGVVAIALAAWFVMGDPSTSRPTVATVAPSASPSPTVHTPTPSGEVTDSTGVATEAVYVMGSTLVDGDVRLPLPLTAGPVSAVGRWGSGYAVRAGQGREQALLSVAGDGAVEQRATGAFGMLVTPDGEWLVWSEAGGTGTTTVRAEFADIYPGQSEVVEGAWRPVGALSAAGDPGPQVILGRIDGAPGAMVWNLGTGDVQRLAGPEVTPTAAGAGSMVVKATDATRNCIAVYRLRSTERTLAGDSCEWEPLSWSPDGRLLAAASLTSTDIGPRRFALLDPDTLAVVAELTAVASQEHVPVWETATSLVMIAESSATGEGVELVRCAIDGNCTSAADTDIDAAAVSAMGR